VGKTWDERRGNSLCGGVVSLGVTMSPGLHDEHTSRCSSCMVSSPQNEHTPTKTMPPPFCVLVIPSLKTHLQRKKNRFRFIKEVLKVLLLNSER
jgi:hypothetical protein